MSTPGSHTESEVERLSRERNHLFVAVKRLLECPEISDDAERVSLFTARVRDEAQRLLKAYKSDEEKSNG